MKKQVCALLFVLWLLAGCSTIINKLDETIVPSSLAVTPVRKAMASVTVVPLSTTPTWQPTPLPSSATPTNSPTPTRLVSMIHTQCLEVADGLGDNPAPAGVLLFNNSGNTDAFLWNMQAGNKIHFPGQEGDCLLGFAVSPDRTRVVYISVSSDKTRTAIITKSDGRPIWTGDDVLHSWFDNDRLLGVASDSEGLFLHLILQNQFTGERQEVSLDFPNQYQGPLQPDWPRGGYGMYDPTLTRAVYAEWNLEFQEKFSSTPGWPVVLWDVENEQVLARLITTDIFGGTPIWSLDGEWFIIATSLDPDAEGYSDGFYTVSRDGQVKQLAYFPGMVILNSYSLSSDSHFVAFWLAEESKKWELARLAVLDITTGAVTDYCIPNTTPGYLVTPIWSPNGTQLLLDVPGSDVKPPEHLPRSAVLVDLIQGWATLIDQSHAPVGWMK